MTFRIRSGHKGLALRLHDLEASIMDVVWGKRMVAFAVSDVLKVLQGERDLAYTTVMTTVARLHAKGLLSRKLDGRRYLYSPVVSRQEFLESTAREVLNQAIGGHRALAMLSEKVSEASSDELDQLEALIVQRRRELTDE